MSSIPVSAVMALLQQRSPAAVVRFVVPVGVYAIQRIPAFRARPHVSEEVLEGVPAFAHFNPSPPIKRVLRRARVLASLEHGVPSPVLNPVSRLWATCATLYASGSLYPAGMHLTVSEPRSSLALTAVDTATSVLGGNGYRSSRVVALDNQRITVASPSSVMGVAPSALFGAPFATINKAGFESRLWRHRGPFTVSRPRLFAAARGLFAAFKYTPDGGVCVPNVGCFSLPSR